jgi:hypothetical protein
VAVTDHRRDAGKAGEFFRSALGVAAGGNDAGAGIDAVGAANESTGFPVGFGSNAAGVDDNYVRVGWPAFFETSGPQEAGDSFAIGARGAATEILDVKRRRHGFSLAELGVIAEIAGLAALAGLVLVQLAGILTRTCSIYWR